MNKVAIYLRVSTTHQIDKDSLPMQRQDLIAYSKLILNTEDYEIFEDAGYSGKNTDRPMFQKMMAEVRKGSFTHILVWKIDRISRNLLDFSTMYKELKDLGVIFVSKNEQFDTSSAMGEAMLKIILVFAELERNMTSERVSATMIARATNGEWNGGRVPYGYNYNHKTKEFSINEEEAEIVRYIHDSYQTNPSLIRLSNDLNENGFRTRNGNLWNPPSLHIILNSVFYAGDYRYNVLSEGNRQKVKDEKEWVIIENHHAPIVDKKEKEKIFTLLSKNDKTKHRKTSSTKNIHLFQGHIFCAYCKKALIASPSNKDRKHIYSNYRCSSKNLIRSQNCGSTSDPIVADFVLSFIFNITKCTDKMALADAKNCILKGSLFKSVTVHEHEVAALLEIISRSTNKREVFNLPKDKKIKSNQSSKLKVEKAKIERAIERLTKLYLYSDEAMPEEEFIQSKKDLIEKSNEINKKLEESQPIPSKKDEEFIKKASEFIFIKKFQKKNTFSYQRLITEVERETIKYFLDDVIDKVYIYQNKVSKIVFKNELTFSFKDV